LGDFFDRKHFQKTISTLTKEREHGFRTYLILMMLSMAFYAFQRDEKPYLYLYTQLKLNWNTDIYSNFKTFQSGSFVLIMLIFVPIFNRVFKWKDTIIVAIGSIAHSLGRVFFILANSNQMMFIGSGVASFGPIVAPALRSITSKLVSAEERGSTFALLSACDNAIPLFSGIFYTQLYNATIKTFPASIFVLTISTQVFVLLSIL
jgi:PCFT/HCP family folate transporter-like MFS transporter 1/3